MDSPPQIHKYQRYPYNKIHGWPDKNPSGEVLSVDHDKIVWLCDSCGAPRPGRQHKAYSPAKPRCRRCNHCGMVALFA